MTSKELFELEYGFVYIWRDSKSNRYYIGCHWGSENDGYVCSSPWMKRAFIRRPNDFRRRVLQRVFSSRAEMFQEEAKWQSLIKDDELRTKYYNIKRHGDNHWSKNENSRKSVSEKLSSTMKAKHQDLDYQKIYVEGRQKAAMKNKGKLRNEEFKQSASELARNRSPETRRKISENNKRLQAQGLIGMQGKRHSEETRRKQSEAAKNKPMLECTHCHKTTRVLTNYNRWHGNNCKHK